MAWTASAIFREWPIMMFQASGTGYTGLDSDTVNVALFNNSSTPDKDAALANAAYGVAATPWATGNEVTDATNWPAGGRALASKTFTSPSSGVAMFDAADLAGGGTLTLAAFYGCLVYDNTISGGSVAKQGVSFNYLGGVQQVTGGTVTIIWNANGLARFTV